MSNNVISIGLATVTLAVAGYVAVVVTAGPSGGDSGIREELAEINDRLDRLEKLRTDVESLDKSVGRFFLSQTHTRHSFFRRRDQRLRNHGRG